MTVKSNDMSRSSRAPARIPASDLARVDAHVIGGQEYDELPEITDADVAGAVLAKGAVWPDLARRPETSAKGGRPLKADRKIHTGLRLSPDVLAEFRATGPGWQTRIDDALRDWLKAHPGAA